jgi:short-subunit dehydrogenase
MDKGLRTKDSLGGDLMAEPMFALITGASSGIGECFARALAARGRNLVLVARSQDKLAALARELGAKHAVRAEVVPLDLSGTGAAVRLAQLLRERNLAVDLLINNAGFGAHGEFWQLPWERQSEMLRLNIQALVELTYLLLPAMIEARRGAIVNVSSTDSFQPVPYTAVYSATKAFVTSFSMALAEELRAYGIRVVTLCPGGTRTNFFDASQYAKRDFAGGLQAPEEVVRVGLKSLDRRGGLAISGLINKLQVASQRLAPRALVARVAGQMFRPKKAEGRKQ